MFVSVHVLFADYNFVEVSPAQHALRRRPSILVFIDFFTLYMYVYTFGIDGPEAFQDVK